MLTTHSSTPHEQRRDKARKQRRIIEKEDNPTMHFTEMISSGANVSCRTTRDETDSEGKSQDKCESWCLWCSTSHPGGERGERQTSVSAGLVPDHDQQNTSLV